MPERQSMSEKIEWYKEVLTLEPNSKLFFPLARMLSEEGRVDEALDVLRKGLSRHDEYIEARLLFIDLLYKSGTDPEETQEQIRKMHALFAGYAGFWQAWAAFLSKIEPDSADTASVIHFLAASFTLKAPVSLSEVLEKGLNAILHESGEADAAEHKPSFVSGGLGQSAAPSSAGGDPASHAPLREPSDERTAGRDIEIPLSDGRLTGSPKTGIRAASSITVQVPIEHVEAEEEHFSLRTRSMGVVLAEQGDVKGALDIYHELAAAASTPEENAELMHRMATLRSMLTSEHAQKESSPSARDETSGTGKTRLISILESLAERVEARAQS